MYFLKPMLGRTGVRHRCSMYLTLYSTELLHACCGMVPCHGWILHSLAPAASGWCSQTVGRYNGVGPRWAWNYVGR